MKTVLPIILVLALCGIASACPFCADTIHNNDIQTVGSLGGAMNISIYCMFIGFFVALGIVVRAVLKGIRN
ncbi:MAG TPA: hypothetical protein VG722_02960 [Tepidisphaeraceae bacterium]|nr:hypothetical protein [Tepidisphaeraceae bacterium]